jgi:SAM-dependent methyltransferase
MQKKTSAVAESLRQQRPYWDSNLDTKNLSSGDEGQRLDLDEEIAFLSSPEYLCAREQMGDVSGLAVLDIGCGMGVNALALARAGARVVAFDLSLQRLKALKAWAVEEGVGDRILPLQGAIESAPLRGDSLDRAFTKSVLIHAQIDEAAVEIARTLAPGGRGVFIEPARFNPLVAVYRLLFAPKIWRTIATYFDRARWARFAAPFASAERRPFFFLSFFAFYWQFARRDRQRFERATRFLGRIDEALFRLCPPLKALRWMDVMMVSKNAPPTAPAAPPRSR